MAPPEELRRGPRAPLRLRVGYEQMNTFFSDYTKNFSQGGTFIKTPRPLEVGSRCQFSFSLPALADPLLIEGEVAWILKAEEAERRGGEAGMGIRFVFADEAARREFEHLVERLMEESLGPQAAQGLLTRSRR
ncbi:MAG TPA: TIGR02266 family protein [Myxococcales bacterium]|nr:TIGR02266 family protein [Myxococcales bacterium]